MTNYYNERNGWVDTGKKITDRKCPNCGSHNFIESVSREYCPDCGLECDYWGRGANEVYENMMARDAAIEREQREEEDRKYYEENYGSRGGWAWDEDDY